MKPQSDQDQHTSRSSLTRASSHTWEPDWSSVPSEPGVYWFSDANGNVLYVGKAKNLINRMRSYARGARHSHRIEQLVHTATQLQFKVLESELQALLTEAELIRTYQPQYNILLKDDKTPLYIYVTNEPFPRILQMRKNEVLKEKLHGGTLLGPFPSAYQVREVLKIARPIFPWCNKLAGVSGGKGLKRDRGLSIAQQGIANTQQKACFYYHLDLCPGACVGEVTAEEYQETISQLVLFLRGKAQDVQRNLKKKMNAHVAAEEFEAAGAIRDALKNIEAVTTKPFRLKPNISLPALTANEAKDGVIFLQQLLATYLSLPKLHALRRIEGYDVSNISGTNAAVAMVTFCDGYSEPSEYRVFNIRSLDTPNDYHMMKEALLRRQNHPEWGAPDLIVIDGGKGQLRAALSVWQQQAPVISIAKDPDRIIIPKVSWPVVSHALPLSLKKLEYHVLELPPTHPGLVLIQKIRNEAHRFSKKQHTRRRTKALFE